MAHSCRRHCHRISTASLIHRTLTQILSSQNKWIRYPKRRIPSLVWGERILIDSSPNSHKSCDKNWPTMATSSLRHCPTPLNSFRLAHFQWMIIDDQVYDSLHHRYCPQHRYSHVKLSLWNNVGFFSWTQQDTGPLARIDVRSAAAGHH